MIVTALGLITGGRGDAARVRAGSDRAVVEVRLAVEPDGAGAATVSCRRRPVRRGRHRHRGAFRRRRRPLPRARGRPVRPAGDPVRADRSADRGARAVGGDLACSVPASNAPCWTSSPASTTNSGATAQLRARWQQLAADLADRRARARERAQREQLLRLGLAEIAAVAPLPGEDRELIAEAKRLENVDGLRLAAQGAMLSRCPGRRSSPASPPTLRRPSAWSRTRGTTWTGPPTRG